MSRETLSSTIKGSTDYAGTRPAPWCAEAHRRTRVALARWGVSIFNQLAHAMLGVILICVSASAAQAPAGTTPAVPNFRVEIWGVSADDFQRRMSEYADLRSTLQLGLPQLMVTENPAEIRAAEGALARRIREARGSRQGELFTPVISVGFRKVLLAEVTENTLVAIMDDNPGEFSHRINGSYPLDRTYSTVPANILASLPPLPEDIQYRFLGRSLILLDTRANVILDRIQCAVECKAGWLW